MVTKGNPPLDRKSEVSRLLRLGLFGNKLRDWPDPDAVPRILHQSMLFAVRFLEPGRPFRTDMAWPELLRYWTKHPYPRYVAEAAPHSRILIQGEFARYAFGLPYFFYSFAKTPQREALADHSNCHDAWGSRALEIIRHYLSPQSQAELDDIFEGWPEAVVELSAFDCHLGDRPGRNAIIWEVRAGY